MPFFFVFDVTVGHCFAFGPYPGDQNGLFAASALKLWAYFVVFSLFGDGAALFLRFLERLFQFLYDIRRFMVLLRHFVLILPLFSFFLLHIFHPFFIDNSNKW